MHHPARIRVFSSWPLVRRVVELPDAGALLEVGDPGAGGRAVDAAGRDSAAQQLPCQIKRLPNKSDKSHVRWQGSPYLRSKVRSNTEPVFSVKILRTIFMAKDVYKKKLC
jgi:hypothetical protein